jgi:hypothetical protein
MRGLTDAADRGGAAATFVAWEPVGSDRVAGGLPPGP